MPAVSSPYVDPITRRVIGAWAAREPARAPVFSPLAKPLAECRVALLSTAGLARAQDPPFDQEGERRDPWWGDPSHRLIPRRTAAQELRSWHLHIDTRPLEQDLDCVLPLARLEELVAAGAVGDVAPSHYAMMGYLLDTAELEQRTAPQIAARLRDEQVDALLLVPV